MMFKYKITHKSKISKARTGTFNTPHGVINTPVFMPVGTVGAVKTMMPSELSDLGSQIILGNTYHLYLRPGDKLIKKLGGLQKFAAWNKPMLTDSGGFQVFSLGEGRNDFRRNRRSLDPTSLKLRGAGKLGMTPLKSSKIEERGVTFYSHIDGSKHFISPEKSIEIQENLGADIIMAFDHVPPADTPRHAVEEAMDRTHRWLERCIKAQKRGDQALFPICQGGQFKDLRNKSANFIKKLDMPGNAIGGVSVGETKQKIYQVTDWCTDILPENKPRYLMGIGYPEDICEVVKRGIDMFDCVLPTRLARHGNVWVKQELKTKNKKLKNNKIVPLVGLDYGYEQIDLSKTKNLSFKPIDEKCPCPACQGFSRFYLNHLLKEQEPLGIHLLTIHNLYFTHQLVRDLKVSIGENRI